MGTRTRAALGSIALCVAAGCCEERLQPASGQDTAPPPTVTADAQASFTYRLCNRDPRNQTKFLGIDPVTQDGGAPCFASYEVSFGAVVSSCSCAPAVAACAAVIDQLQADAAACLAFQ